MTVPTSFADLSQTPGSNTTLINGATDAIGVYDNHLRAVYAMLASMYANAATNGWVSPYVATDSALVTELEAANDQLGILSTADRIYPTWNGVSIGNAQFRGATDTASSLGTLAIVINADSDATAAVSFETGDVTQSSEINGASAGGAWRMWTAEAEVTRVYVGQLGFTAPLSVTTTSPVLAANKEFMHFDFALSDSVKYVVWHEGPPTNYAGEPGTGSARQVTVFGIQGTFA